MQVRVDNSKWEIIDLNDNNTSYNNLVLLKTNLSDKNHTLEIKPLDNNLINIDYFVANNISTSKTSNNFKVILTILVLIISLISTLFYKFINKKEVR